jgi:hypothetical protein
VGVTRFKLNAQLLRYLQKDHEAGERKSLPNPSQLSYHKHRRWRVRNRLSKEDIAEIVRAFKAGTAKHVLADRYDINLRSLKKLLRDDERTSREICCQCKERAEAAAGTWGETVIAVGYSGVALLRMPQWHRCGTPTSSAVSATSGALNDAVMDEIIPISLDARRWRMLSYSARAILLYTAQTWLC